jgi:hypothetical protein
MGLNKKGIFFTFIAISLIGIVILTAATKLEYKLRNKMDVTETRVKTINNLIQNIEKDLNKGLYITGFRSLLALEQ